ncbi:MAG: hypothetical protein FWG65_02675 [Turicibacter sp.]|nr:hypothetical protein [Turicibacter sp.]
MIFIERILFPAITILVIVAIVTFFSRRAFRDFNTPSKKLLEEELKANSARKHDVEAEFFYTPEPHLLPIREDAEVKIKKAQDNVLLLASKTMLVFPQKRTNLELKFAYGAANLEKVTLYEENYNKYVQALVKWGDLLFETGGKAEMADAIIIFEKTLELGGEFRKIYKHLAEHYAKMGDKARLNGLIEKVNVTFGDEGIKNNLISHIQSFL